MAAARPAAVGAFVLGGLALVVAGIVFFGGSRLFEHTTRAVIFFEGSIAGLDIGAPVTFRGVRVGSVQSMALFLSAEGRAQIPVTIEILPGRVTIDGADPRQSDTSLERLVQAGLRAQLNLQSFVTGQLQVDLDFRPGTPAEKVQMDTGGLAQIPALASDLERLRATLAEVPVLELAQSTQRVLLAVERLVSRLDADLGPLLGSLRQGAESATRILGTTEQAVTRLQADASRTLGELDQLAAAARHQMDDRGADLARTLASAERAGRQAEALAGSLAGLIGPRAPLRGDLEAAARDLAASASSLRGFARAVERDPSALLRGRGDR
jgi:paraquat-inducible protein B